MNLRETAENLVEFARHSKQEELDNVIEAVVNFAREQRINILNETLRYNPLSRCTGYNTI